MITSWQRGHRHPVLAAGPAGPRARGGPRPGRAPRLRRGLRRGPLDGRGGDRPRRAAAGDHRGAVRPVRLPAGRLAGDEGGRRAAQPVRRARGRQGRLAETAADRRRRVPDRRTDGPIARSRCTSGISPSPTSVAGRRPSSPLEPGVDVLVGPNGQGKTNLVEALGYLATLGSHRVATDAPLVRRGAERAVVRGRGGRPRAASCCVELEIMPGQGQPGPAQPGAGAPGPGRARRAAHGAVRARGPGAGPRRPGRAAPVPRRAAGARAPRLAGVRADYDRVLKQRNALLEVGRAGPPRRARRRTCAPSTSGTTTSPSTARQLLAGPAGAGRRACARTSAKALRRRSRRPARG